MNKATLIANLLIAALPAMSCADGRQKETESMYKYTIVSEDAPHEGTWLARPHHHTYGTAYRDSIEPVWVAMAAALSRRRSGGLVSALGRGAGPWRPQRHVRQPLRHRGVSALGHDGLLS